MFPIVQGMQVLAGVHDPIYAPVFRELRAGAGRPLPDYVQEDFAAYVKCGRLEEGFLRVRCEQCHAEKLAAFSCKKRGFCPSCGARRMAETAALLVDYRAIAGYVIGQAGLTRRSGHTGAVTLVQRFGSALNLNVHFHMLFLDGAYRSAGTAPPEFHPVAAPGAGDLQTLVERIAEGVGRALEKRGLIERDMENAWLANDSEAGPIDDLIGHSITYRIAAAPGRHHAHRAGPAGPDAAAGGAVAAAADAPDAIPRGVRPAQPVAGSGDAGPSGHGCGQGVWPGSRCRQTGDTETRVDELGAAAL